jgi:hypothetical protein
MDSEHKAVFEIMDAAYNAGGILLPFRVTETGNASTRAIATWFYQLHLKLYEQNRKSPCWHKDGKYMTMAFDSVSLDGRLQESIHHQLELDGTAPWCTFRTQDPAKYLSEHSFSKIVFLDPANLTRGLEQFSLAASTGCGRIVMHNYQSKAAFAIREAQTLGWEMTAVGPYFTLVRK